MYESFPNYSSEEANKNCMAKRGQRCTPEEATDAFDHNFPRPSTSILKLV